MAVYDATSTEIDIVLRDYKNTPANYGFPERLRVDTSDGGVTEYIHESLIPEDTGGGGSASPVSAPEWINDICFWDYDGTLLLNIPVSQAKSLKELPVPPEHDGLIFREWNHTLDELKAATYPRDVGATYRTADGHTHAFLNVSSSSYKAVPIYFGQTVDGGVTIDWGDGATSTVAGTGNVTTTHTYAATGKYEVILKVATGCTLTLGHGSSSTMFIGGSNSSYKNCLTELYIGDGVLVSAYFASGSYLTKMTLPVGLNLIPDGVGYNDTRLSALIIPRGVTATGIYLASSIGNYNVKTPTIISLPETVETLGNYNINGVYDVLRFIFPPKIATIGNNNVYQCYNIRKVFMGDAVTSIGASFLYGCYSITEFIIPKGVTTIGNHFGKDAGLLDIVLPESVTTLGQYFGNTGALRRLVVKGTLTSVGTYPLDKYTLEIVMCSQTSPSSAISSLISKKSERYLYVPDDAVNRYVNYVSSDYKARVCPLSEYLGVIPE